MGNMMLSSAKTFFPDLFKAIKRWPIWLRIVLFLIVVSIPVVLSGEYVATLLNFLITPLQLTPIIISGSLIIVAFAAWLLSQINKQAKQQRLIYQFCDAWLEYLPFIFLLVTKIHGHELQKQKDIFKFMDENKEDLKKFHIWRAKLRELLFKVGEKNLYIADNLHWEKLKKESTVLETQSYLTPFSFILDQTQPWLIAVAHQNEAWTALHISDEFIERAAFKYPRVEKLWKRRRQYLEQGA